MSYVLEGLEDALAEAGFLGNVVDRSFFIIRCGGRVYAPMGALAVYTTAEKARAYADTLGCKYTLDEETWMDIVAWWDGDKRADYVLFDFDTEGTGPILQSPIRTKPFISKRFS